MPFPLMRKSFAVHNEIIIINKSLAAARVLHREVNSALLLPYESDRSSLTSGKVYMGEPELMKMMAVHLRQERWGKQN